MSSFFPKMKTLVLVAVLVPAFIACGVNSSDNTGRLSLSLTDKATNTVSAVYITIKQIDVHAVNDAQDIWKTVLTLNQTFKITDFTGGMRKELGIVNLDPGHYSQMRLIIGTEPTGTNTYANWVTDDTGDHELKIPSGVQTGIKFVQGFDINAGNTTELTFDFDASRSIVVAGNSGKYLLKPVIHMIDDSQTRLVIKGTVTGKDALGVEGATVSLQVFNATAVDPKDQVATAFTTLTDSSGGYQFWFLNITTPTTYNLVATDWPSTTPPYGVAWNQIVDAWNDAAGNPYTVNFTLPVLDPTIDPKLDVGTVDITISGADAVEGATLSFRQTAADLVGPPMVEVLQKSYLDGTYSVSLPLGDYTVVAWTTGKATLVLPTTPPLTVTKAGPNKIDVKFL
jgi:Domain of unknown function (DUF4382)